MQAVMVFTLAACSGTTNSTPSSAAGGSEPASGEEENASSEESGEVPVYTVLTNATFPPFDTIDENTGELIGFDMDLITAIGEDQGFQVEFVDMAFESLIPAIETGNGDIIARRHVEPVIRSVLPKWIFLILTGLAVRLCWSKPITRRSPRWTL